ncbi:MAG: hypothetical protein JSU66_11000 [Deltaproteobacteria bacterium]|nr:MAG: hypothetical protein JSU66_11000 [Deltaproteobacteria bacterium]
MGPTETAKETQMRTIAALALAAFALAILPGSAPAGEGCKKFDVVSHIFDTADTDGSGTLSRQEYSDAGLERYGVAFDEYDVNSDGEASFEEYLDVYKRHHRAEGEIEV